MISEWLISSASFIEKYVCHTKQLTINNAYLAFITQTKFIAKLNSGLLSDQGTNCSIHMGIFQSLNFPTTTVSMNF